MQKPSILIGIVEDHTILREGLKFLINQFENCKVILDVNNGRELQEALQNKTAPDIIILDIEMPVMNGYETLDWLQNTYPGIHVIILSMYDSEFTTIRLLRAGAKAFLKKNISSTELKNAIWSVIETGFYYNDSISRKLLTALHNDAKLNSDFRNHLLTAKELGFLKLSAGDLTYEEIADEMNCSVRAVDKIRDHLFFKFDVKNRAALAVRSMKEGVIV